MKIGIPKALHYHKYGYLWKKFFEYLDIPYVVSCATNKKYNFHMESVDRYLISGGEFCYNFTRMWKTNKSY